MIKIIATITMIIDHIGAFFFTSLIYRVMTFIGRLSMPLFAYCVGRGFYYSEKKGTVFKYLKNLAIFSVISQVPFTITRMWVCGDFYLNIGFIWFLSVLFLKAISYIKKPVDRNVIIAVSVAVLVLLTVIFAPIEYGLPAFLFPVMFYFFAFKTDNPILCFLSAIFLCFMFDITKGSFASNFLYMFPVFIVFFIRSYDNKISLPRRFFYWFYPVHFFVLLIIRYILATYKILNI